MSRLVEADARRIPPDLEARLAAAVDAGRAAWPGLPVDDELFVGYVAERFPAASDAEVEQGLDELHAADLHVSCAAALGLPGGIEALDARYLSAVAAAVAPIDASPGFADEVCQLLRNKLFVSDAGELPKIATYAGRYPLASWLGMAARRTALSLRRSEAAHARAGAAALAQALPEASDDVELDYLRTRYESQFRDAFRDAIGALTERERLLLRLHVVEGQSHESIGRIYQVHQTTVSRWIAAARDSIAAMTERLLRERLALSASEFHSIAKIVGADLQLSLTRWLATP